MRSTRAVIIGYLAALALVSCAIDQHADLRSRKFERRADRPQQNTQGQHGERVAWVGVNGPGTGWSAEMPRGGFVDDGRQGHFYSGRVDPAIAYGRADVRHSMSPNHGRPDHPTQVAGGAIGRLVAMADITVASGGQARAVSMAGGNIVRQHHFRGGRHAVNALGNGEPGSAQIFVEVTRPGSVHVSALDHSRLVPQDHSRRLARDRLLPESKGGHPNTPPNNRGLQFGSIQQQGMSQPQRGEQQRGIGQQGGKGPAAGSTLQTSNKVLRTDTKLSRNSSPPRKSGKRS